MKKYLSVSLVIVALVAGLMVRGVVEGEKGVGDLSGDEVSIPSAVESRGTPSDSVHVESGVARSRSAEYLSRFEAVKDNALRGDAAAQLELSGMYDRCFSVSMSRQQYLSGVDAMALQAGKAAATMKATARRIADDCALVEGGSPIPLDAQKEWLKASAASGNLAAKIRFHVRYAGEASESVADLVQAAVERRDSEAMFELADLLSTQSSGAELGPFEAVAGDETSAYAWGIVACRMGAECGAGSAVIEGSCLNGACASNYEQLVRNDLLPKGEGERLDRNIARINSLLGRK
ncbi:MULTISPECIES: hypothetical protein [Xanthomonas]|uniref:hypothetical protein n=1 Tax=Xanthomonas TaxID=338 RepID=UPI001ADAF298|nr:MULTISPECIES: hypothetical protein [Xanthomonas]MBO9879816.1 hypothetical protein [Xanthomonas sp. D-109]